jgi:hypothetical protein
MWIGGRSAPISDAQKSDLQPIHRGDLRRQVVVTNAEATDLAHSQEVRSVGYGDHCRGPTARSIRSERDITIHQDPRCTLVVELSGTFVRFVHALMLPA